MSWTAVPVPQTTFWLSSAWLSSAWLSSALTPHERRRLIALRKLARHYYNPGVMRPDCVRNGRRRWLSRSLAVIPARWPAAVDACHDALFPFWAEISERIGTALSAHQDLLTFVASFGRHHEQWARKQGNRSTNLWSTRFRLVAAEADQCT
jgi:hypothetical protein